MPFASYVDCFLFAKASTDSFSVRFECEEKAASSLFGRRGHVANLDLDDAIGLE